MPAPLNVLYIHSHDTGRYIQPYGHAVPTPNMQAFAERGVLFRQAFCAGPTCSPSRSALLTGANPHRNGMLGLRHRGFGLAHPEWHLARFLEEHGYRTAAFGNEHVTDNPAPHESVWQTQEPLGRAPALERARRAVEWLAEGDRSAPFFLSLGFFDTHRPFPEPGPECDARYLQPPACLPDTPETRRDMAAFHQMARDLDTAFGRVMADLARLDLARDTLIISTTDHGIAFPRMKCNLQDTGIGVLLMLKSPGLPAGQVIDSMVTHLDLFPTICDLAGLPRPGWLEGRSLLPLLRGDLDPARPDALHEEIFSEVTFHAAYEPQRAVRTPRWKYIRRCAENPVVLSPNCDDGPSKTLWIEAGWRGRPLETELLYDLLFDPMESNNLAASPAHAEVLADLRGRLHAWMERTDDPILNGPVPLPPGCRDDGPGTPS
jgi:N-sulfoglucosamine sulfohydrolase